MWRFLPLVVAAPLAYVFPFHYSIGALALFGVWHVVSELDYFSSRYRLFRRRKTFRPVTFVGAAVLAATMLPFAFSEFSNARGVRYLFVTLHLAIAAWLVLSLWGKTSGKAASFALLTLAVAMPVLAALKPLLLLFLLIHLHNLVPWVFYLRRKGGFPSLLTAVFWAAIFPMGTFFLLALAGVEVARYGLDIILERDLYEHVVPDLWPWENPVLLLCFFAYQQFLHYLMWIVILPGTLPQSALPRGEVFSELAFFAGFARLTQGKSQLIALVLIAASLALFVIFTVEWRRVYFALAQFHVLLELPLIWLTAGSRSGP